MQSVISHSDIRSKTEFECKRAVGIVLGWRERNIATCGFVGCLNRRFIDMCVCEGGGDDVKQLQATWGARCDKKVTGLYLVFHKENQIEEMSIVTVENIICSHGIY